MVKVINCDIFESGADVICHQVNCQGKMGSGIAAQIRKRYPWVYAEYKNFLSFYKEDKELILGCYQNVFIDENRSIINIFGQLDYGRDGKCYTNYEELNRCLKNISKDKDLIGKTIAFPYKIGCGLAGGDWNIVYKMICDAFENTDHTVLICKL